jgi:glucose/arabinose dehydrogenase
LKSIVIFSILFVGVFFVSLSPNAQGEPILYDENLILEKYVSEWGWGFTTMTFVEEDILLLEKDGFVSLIRDGVIQQEPVLEINVDPIQESGLLGITSVGSTIYLYFTEDDKDGNQLGNRIYKYDWNGEELINPILLKELPSNNYHNSGAMVTGLDDQVYAVIGDTGKYGPLQNKLLENLFPPDTLDYMDTSSILRVDPEGPYYAIGIRNSFGLAIDPVTGNLWATENGDDDFDEINFVPEKFNSGWNKIMGPATESELDSLPGYEDYIYKDPEFSWEKVVAPVGLNFGKFKETDNYDNSLFVGDCSKGNLYKFELNENRDGFEFSNPDLQDNLVNENDSMDEIIIGTGFQCITDIERGPDGFLYLVTHGERAIYRILPIEALEDQSAESKENLGEKASDAGEAIVEAGTETGELVVEVGKEAGKVIVNTGEEVVEKGKEVGQTIIEKEEELHQKVDEKRIETKEAIEQKSSEVIQEIEDASGGGCLIATATYGSELAPEVQKLREIRDVKLLQTESGSAFMSTFNDFYYSFSPEIADLERKNPVFKETVKVALIPMISSLSILNFVDMDSEVSVLGYGTSLILLNIGMYVGIPVAVIVGIQKNSR